MDPNLSWWTHTVRAVIFGLAVLCFALAAVADLTHLRRVALVPAGLALLTAVWCIDAIDAA
jgi:hypothetical protein